MIEKVDLVYPCRLDKKILSFSHKSKDNSLYKGDHLVEKLEK